jgi:hypothetical protein
VGKFRKIVRLVRERLRAGREGNGYGALEHAVRIATAPRAKTSQISPGLVLGGQYRGRGWPRIEAAGVTGVLNLRMEYCDRDAGIAPAAYLRLPTVDDEAPTVDQLKQGIAFIEDQMRKAAESMFTAVQAWAGLRRWLRLTW